jgi:hypothetical protein
METADTGLGRPDSSVGGVGRGEVVVGEVEVGRGPLLELLVVVSYEGRSVGEQRAGRCAGRARRRGRLRPRPSRCARRPRAPESPSGTSAMERCSVARARPARPALRCLALIGQETGASPTYTSGQRSTPLGPGDQSSPSGSCAARHARPLRTTRTRWSSTQSRFGLRRWPCQAECSRASSSSTSSTSFDHVSSVTLSNRGSRHERFEWVTEYS